MSGVPIRPPSGSIIAFTGIAVLTYGLISLALILLGLVLVRQAVVIRRRASIDEPGRRGGAHLRTYPAPKHRKTTTPTSQPRST